ncbi:DUF6267 family protein [Hyphomonas sp.]|mgnify:CR=1 FL=1|uniref:DUF6267 family protein n=1 Tax=Hyphomonas sp. TaxID=87 RepID=UPI000C992186|nr:DUF6267 family protein [Hyphomonas sp.]MAL45759.1 hypothetical protein [Hyphomonas sp.]
MSLLDEGKANTHLTHLEELVLTQGPKGYKMARAFLLELLEELKGNVDSRVKTSVKWDGAPAIFAGINPENGKFFVGTKSIFNKEPKINYTPEDVQRNHGHAPGLVDKLTKALQYLPPLGIQKILQGDFMFDDEMIKTIEVDGEPHYAFKPNTITYAAPVESKLGQEIAESKFGIVFHTTYDSLDGGASFGADVSGLNKVPGVWVDDAYFTDDTGTVTLTEDEEAKVKELVAAADQVNEKIDYEGLPMDLLNIYINSEIKGGEFLEDPAKSFLGFKRWYSGRLEKRIDKLKSARGKMRATEKGQEMLAAFDDKQEDILNLFRVSRLLFEAKNIFISKYNNAVYNTKHFIDDGSGDLVASNPEGYVAVDHIGNGVKFVDRLEFSKANFAVDKGAKFQQTESLTVYWGSDGFSVTKTLLEWSQNLPVVENKNQELYENLLGGAPITSLVREASEVKTALAEAVNWALNENFAVDAAVGTLKRFVGSKFPKYKDSLKLIEEQGKRVIAIYPGRFQPMGRHHYATYKALADQFGAENTFIVTSNKMGPKSPLDFDEKKKIMVAHGVPADKIVMSRNPYQAVELTKNFDPATTAVVFAVGGKDMRDSPRFANLDGMTKKGTPAYYKTYRPGEELIGLDKHGYIAIAPHVEIDVPGFGEMSGTTLRKALKGASQEDFKTIMGFYNQEIYDILQGKLEEMSSMAGGNVAGYSLPLGMRAPDVVGSEKKKKRHPKNFIKEEQEIVTEVMDYLLGISVG